MSALLLESTDIVTGEGLDLEREGIVFYNSRPECVTIEVTVRNRGKRRSAPTVAALQAAPLGAFAPWQPLTTLAVPSLEAGQSSVLRTQVRRPRVRPLGKVEQVSPRQLLTAIGLQQSTTGLPADLFELLGHSNPHWAGNLNIFIGSHAVERHLAQALRIYPGRTNLAMFVVGSGPDAYAFHLSGEGARWDAAIFSVTGERSAVPLWVDVDRDTPVAERDWIEFSGRGMMMLAMRPPEHCKRGEIHVHVEQRSTGREATVEFSLDPAAAGPGCFRVD